MGKQINQSIVIDAKIKATLEGMNDVVSKLNKGLREGTTKIDLTKGVGNSISKQIETFKTEYSKFTQLTKDGKIEFGDAKDAIRSGEQMVKTFSELKRIVGNFEDMSLLDAKKMFPDAFDSRVDLLSKKLNTLRENIVSLDSKKIELNDARQALSDLTVKQQALQKELSEQLEVKIDTETAEQNLEEAKKKIAELRDELKKELSGKLAGTESIKNSLETRKTEILNARKARGVTSEPLSGAQVKAAGGSKEQQAAASQALKLYNSEKAELKEIEEALKKNTAAAKEYRKALTSADSAKLTDLADKAEASEGKINEITDALKKQEQAQIDLNEASERREQQEAKTSSIKKELDETTRSLELQEQKVNKLQTAYNQLIAKTNPEELTKAFKDLGIDFTPEMAKNEQAVRQLQEQLNALDEQDHQKLIQSLQKMGLSADNAEDYVRQLKGQLTTIDDSAKDISRAAQEMENLKNQVLQFFSITNAIQLFKRAVTSALNTVKELDATMTEAAVVTEFDIGDMWEKLPEYSERAQELGVAINDMYGATTLYYQQGLKTNAAMKLGAETMKMGKIAAMDSTEATKAMTAALRGFNMELNETSAVRVNDVYSQLAAVTAADTNQIATAMEKTASIAASANMEFETTAAFLSQIIETTQEAPETAGTALKTIIARFAEVKSLRDQGLTSGEDDEGEIIDVNKIQTALRTVGISMEGFFNGTEGLDSILLKLSEKWGGLDFETQRYIATMAAGSRQQSRFIAMMSDYGRTTELVGAAQNSAGASQKQFEKTQESLATSLTKLKNAWDQFLMGLANNEILKASVDGLTKILETINKITEGISGGNGLVKSVISLAGVLATLKGGKTLLGGNAVGGAMSGLVEKITGKKNIDDTSNKNSYFGLPKGVDPGSGWSKEEWQRGKKAKQAQMAANRPSLKQNFTKKTKEDYSKVSKNLGKMEIGLSQDDISARAMGIRKLNEELAEGIITEKEAAEGYVKLGGSLDELEAKAAKTIPNFDTIGQAANTAGMAMMAAGAATSLLASAFESWGMEEEAEAMQTLSGVLMTLGPILMGIGSFLPVLTGLTAAQAAATWAALWPVLAIVAALGALVIAIVLVSKAAHENSLEGRMEAAAEATERAKEAAESAKQAYDDLLSAKSGYNELQNKLDELTKGTLEWKQALADSNAQVLELLDKYPELAKFLTRGEHGELEITEGGWGYIEEKKQQSVQNSQSAVIASQINETRLKREKVEKDLQDIAYRSGISKLVGQGNNVRSVVDKEDVQSIYSKYKEMPDFFESDQVEEFANSIGQTKDEVLAMRDAIIAYDQALAENEVLLQAQSETLLSNSVSEEVTAGEYGNELIAGMAAGFVKNQKTQESAIQQKLYSDKGETDKDYLRSLMKENDLVSTGNNILDLETLYAEMAGITVEEIGEGLKGNAQELAKEIAKMQNTKQAGIRTESAYQKMTSLKEETQQDYSILLSRDISKANRKFAEQYANMSEDQANQMLADLGVTLTDLGFTTIDEMVKSYSEIAKHTQEEFAKIENQALKHGVKINKDYLQNANSKQLQTFTDLMLYSIETGGKDALAKGFDEIFAQATAEQGDKIMNLLSSYDWTQEGAGESFLETLQDIVPNLDLTTESLGDFQEEIKGLNAIFRKFDVADTLNGVKAGYEEAEEIAGQKYLSHEQFAKYIENGVIKDKSEWKWTGKGWENVTNGMSNLVEALKANTIATYKQTVSEAQDQVDWYKNVTKKISDTVGQVYVDRNGQYSIGNVKSKLKDIDGPQTYDEAVVSRGKLVSGNVEKYLASGNASSSIWSQFFASEKAYQEWVEAYAKGGMKETEDFLDVMGMFEAENYQIGEEEEKKDAYDKYYNEYEILTSIARKRERLEKDRNKLLEEGNAIEAQKSRQDEINELNKEKAYQDFLASEKRKEFQALREENLTIAQKAGLGIAEDGTIKFDVSSVNNMKTADREEFDKLLDKLTELRDQMRDAEDRAFEIDINIKDLEKEDRSSYIDFATQVKDALVSQRKEEIDKLKAIDDSINDTNSQILDSMQRQIDETRQARDNAKTEQELADKERRLAYLQQDTSGANAAEILKLQKEIEEGQESYTDQLIDQKISELQKQNDEAAEQRERQIEILEAQMEIWQNGEIWEKVDALIKKAYSSGIENSELGILLKDAAGYDSMLYEEKQVFMEELLTNFGNAYVYKNTDYASGDGGSGGGAGGNTGGASGGNTGGTGNTGGNTSGNNDPSIFTEEDYEAFKNLGIIRKKDTGKDVKVLQKALNLWPDGGTIAVDGIFGDRTEAKLAEVIGANETMWNDIDGSVFGYYDKDLLLDNFPKFETGGLASFTGPAWLDGTKSRPEYVLNADQTKAFFTLVDVLSSLKPNSGIAQNIGESSYDIDINVESIGSDYDVERMAEKIKTLIVDATRYRNNNTL